MRHRRQGTQRKIDLAVEVPGSPLEAVMSHEVWEEIYERLVQLVEAHRTTLITVNTRRLAERMAHQLSERLGDGKRRRASRQPRQGSAPRRRRAAARWQAQGARRDRVARARHRHRPRRPRVPDFFAASHRDVAAARRPLGPYRQRHAEGPHLPADARRPDRMRGDGARSARRRTRPRHGAGPAARRARAADRRRDAAAEEWDEDALFGLFRQAYPYRKLEQQGNSWKWWRCSRAATRRSAAGAAR